MFTPPLYSVHWNPVTNQDLHNMRFCQIESSDISSQKKKKGSLFVDTSYNLDVEKDCIAEIRNKWKECQIQRQE